MENIRTTGKLEGNRSACICGTCKRSVGPMRVKRGSPYGRCNLLLERHDKELTRRLQKIYKT